jgi:general secretion pathway protein E
MRPRDEHPPEPLIVSPASRLALALARLDPSHARFATDAVDLLLAEACSARASDVHLQPTPDGLDLRWRIDGVLQPAGTLPAKIAPNIIARLKVLAELLTYRTDVPQEGRILSAPGAQQMRLSTFPTLFGEKAVIRIFATPGRFLRLDDLELPADVLANLSELLDTTSGAIIFSGPAGSGKTTTLYACLREIAGRSAGRRSLVTLEDPIEAVVTGTAQSQVNAAAGLTLESGLKSLLRQDPEVIAIGEIRDKSTAETALQASLTGHLLLTTFHAGTACEVIGRLLDMGIEPYAVRSGLRAIIAQRLVRRLCACSRPASGFADLLGLPVPHARTPVGCDVCSGTGYLGRIVLAEMLLPDADPLATAILQHADARQLARIAAEAGMTSLWQRACHAVTLGLTAPAEVRRVLGITNPAEAPR